MPTSLYARINLHALRTDGTGANSVPVQVLKSDGTVAEIFSGDNRTGPLPNPVTTDEQGFVTFFAGDHSEDYQANVQDANVQVRTVIFPADTVEKHRQVPDHAIGSIPLEQLSFPLNEPDVLFHAAKESDTHGLGPTENFVHTKAGTAAGATDSPHLTLVEADTLRSPTGGTATQNGSVVIRDMGDLAAAIAATAVGDTIYIAAGAYTTAAAQTFVSGRKIVGLGNVVITAGGAAGIFHLSGAAEQYSFENLTLNSTNGNPCIQITSCDTLRIFRSRFIAGSTTNTIFDNGASRIYIDGCDFQHSGAGSDLERSVGAFGFLSMVNCEGRRSAGGYVVNLNGGGANFLRSFTNCVFINSAGSGGAVRVDEPSAKFHGCYLEGNTALEIAAGGVGCNFSEIGNVQVGGISDTSQFNITEHQKWDWISAIEDINNTGATKLREYFSVGTGGIGGVFNHGLASRTLEIMVEVSNNSLFTDRVWSFSPQVSTVPVDPTAAPGAWQAQPVGANDWGVEIVDGNNFRLVLYAGDVQTGSGTYTNVGRYLWAATKADTLVAGIDKDTYDYTAAGGHALDRVWVRVRARLAR